MPEAPSTVAVHFFVNGRPVHLDVEPRLSLADCLRDQLSLTATHLGCEQGVCGACNVLVDGQVVRSCLLLAAQVEGCQVTTVEGIGAEGGQLSRLQQAFLDHHGLQCGFCTPGMLIAATNLLERTPHPSREQVTSTISGVICRCTGYTDIVDSILAAADAEPR
ncbi:MAG: (2Fe-2S)-binding protein [Sulfobacillus sp.]